MQTLTLPSRSIELNLNFKFISFFQKSLWQCSLINPGSLSAIVSMQWLCRWETFISFFLPSSVESKFSGTLCSFLFEIF